MDHGLDLAYKFIFVKSLSTGLPASHRNGLCGHLVLGKPRFPPGLSFPAGAVGTSPGTCLAHDRAKLGPRGCVWEVQVGEQLSHEASGPDTIDSAVSLRDVKNQNITTALILVGGTKAPDLAQACSHGEKLWGTCLECGGAVCIPPHAKALVCGIEKLRVACRVPGE